MNPQITDALKNLEGLAERWEDTPEWHNPIFRDGLIKINTGDLHDIAVIVRWAQKIQSQNSPVS